MRLARDQCRFRATFKFVCVVFSKSLSENLSFGYFLYRRKYPVETQKAEINDNFRIPDALWEHTKPLLPVEPPKPQGGRPRNDDRHMMDASFSVLRTGLQWKALPRCLGAGSSVHDRLQAWRQAGVFRAMWAAGLMAYDDAKGIAWAWQAMDGAMTQAPLGGVGTGPNPTDRAKSGTKRGVLTEGKGVP